MRRLLISSKIAKKKRKEIALSKRTSRINGKWYIMTSEGLKEVTEQTKKVEIPVV